MEFKNYLDNFKPRKDEITATEGGFYTDRCLNYWFRGNWRSNRRSAFLIAEGSGNEN